MIFLLTMKDKSVTVNAAGAKLHHNELRIQLLVFTGLLLRA